MTGALICSTDYLNSRRKGDSLVQKFPNHSANIYTLFHLVTTLPFYGLYQIVCCLATKLPKIILLGPGKVPAPAPRESTTLELVHLPALSSDCMFSFSKDSVSFKVEDAPSTLPAFLLKALHRTNTIWNNDSWMEVWLLLFCHHVCIAFTYMV